ncbi:MAG: 30S ribosomal protein S20 [Desulfobacterales bacterium]
MANHKSALKRSRQNEIRRMRNKAVRTNMKSAVKNVRLSISENAPEAASKKLDTAASVITKAAKKGVIHKKTAARKISRLAKNINKMNA